MTDLLVWVALAFLLAHLLLDLRTLTKVQGRDLWWTVATILILGGHVLLSHVI